MRLIKSRLQTDRLDKTNKHRRHTLGSRLVMGLVLVAITLSSTLGVLMPSPASAAGTQELDDQIVKNLYRNAVAACISKSPLKDANGLVISEQNIMSFSWFGDGGFAPQAVDVIAGPILHSNYGSASVSSYGDARCADPTFLQEAFTALGYKPQLGNPSSMFALACVAGFYQKSSVPVVDPCPNSKGGEWVRQGLTNGTATALKFLDQTKDKVEPMSDAAKYLLIKNTMVATCRVDSENGVASQTSVSDQTGVRINVLDTTGTGTPPTNFKMVEHLFTFGASDGRYKLSGIVGPIATGEYYSTGILTQGGYTMSLSSIFIISGVRANTVLVGDPKYGNGLGAGTYTGCYDMGRAANGYANAYLEWAKKNFKNILDDTAANSGDNETKTTCPSELGGIGWIFCPIMNALSGFNDLMYGWIEDVLVLNPLKMEDTDGGETASYQNWKAIRDISNVTLVIVFLIVIFSQATSVGINNYGIKKMLPRIIMIAIAINISYFLMMLAIDVANLLGVGLHDLLTSTAISANTENLDFTTLSDALLTGSGVLVGGVAIGVVAAGATSTGAVALALLALPFIAVAALSLLAAVATLFVRNALVIVLVIIAPLALAAYMLPNTEPLFVKWRKLLTSSLLLFPMAALLFAGAKFAAFVVLESGQQYSPIVALFIMAAPLGALPWLMAQSNSILSGVSGRLQKMAQSAKNPLQKALNPAVQAARGRYKDGQTNFWGRDRGPIGEDGQRHRADGRAYRRNLSQTIGDRRRDLEESAKTSDTQAETNWREGGLNPATRRGQRTGGILDASQTAGQRKTAIDEQYGLRLDQRIGTAGSVESHYSNVIKETKDLRTERQGIEETRQSDRILNNEIGVVSGRRLQTVSNRIYGSEKTNEARQKQILRANQDSGIANAAIAEGKRAQEFNEQFDVDRTYDHAQVLNTDPEMVRLRAQKDRTERLTKLEGSTLDLRNARRARQSSTIRAAELQRAQNEFNTSTLDGRTATALEESKTTDPLMRTLEAERRADDQVKKTAAEEQLRQYGEAVSTDGSAIQVRASGTVAPGQVGRIKAQSYGIQAVDEDSTKARKAAEVQTTSGAAAALQAGVRRDAAGALYIPTPAGPNYAPNDVQDALRAGGVIGATGVIADFSDADQQSLSRIQSFVDDPAGAVDFGVLAIGGELIKAKMVNSQGLAGLVGRVTDPIDRAGVITQMNEEANAAGLDYLGFNNLDAAGNFSLGGQKGGVGGVVSGLISKGMQNISKQLLNDPSFGPEAGTQINGIVQTATTAGLGTQEYTDAAYKFRAINDEVLGLMARNIARQRTGNANLAPTAPEAVAALAELEALRRTGRDMPG